MKKLEVTRHTVRCAARHVISCKGKSSCQSAEVKTHGVTKTSGEIKEAFRIAAEKTLEKN